MRSRISIRRCVRPSVRPSVGRSVHPLVSHTRVETIKKWRFWQKLLSVWARTHLMPCIRPCWFWFLLYFFYSNQKYAAFFFGWDCIGTDLCGGDWRRSVHAERHDDGGVGGRRRSGIRLTSWWRRRRWTEGTSTRNVVCYTREKRKNFLAECTRDSKLKEYPIKPTALSMDIFVINIHQQSSWV